MTDRAGGDEDHAIVRAIRVRPLDLPAERPVQTSLGAITSIPAVLLDAGHVPYFGHPERASEQVSGFVRPERDG